MQYMLMLYEDEAIYGPGKAGPAMQEIVGKHYAFRDSLGSARLGGAGLKSAATATTVRNTNGTHAIHDGPFAESKEQAHEDAAGAGRHAGYAAEAIELTNVLVELLPHEPDVLALAALVRYTEARRPARLDADGGMVPLSDQDPARWDRQLIETAHGYLRRCLAADTPRVIQARIHAAWCRRSSLSEPAPWPAVLKLYDALLDRRDDPIVRLNRAVALAEVAGPTAGLADLDRIAADRPAPFLPYMAVRADLLRRVGRLDEARAAYDAALALDPAPAERLWLEQRRAHLAGALPV